ncbi:MAG: hypothetical protein ACAI25_01895, partial [Planctomycetota bacterium]
MIRRASGAPLLLLLAGLAVLGACATSNDKAKGDTQAPATTDTEPPRERLHEKPFSAHFDALLTRFLP